MPSFLDLLKFHLGSAYPINEWQAGRLEAHYKLLSRWNVRLNLTSVPDVEELVVHHYCESFALGSILPMGKFRVMDVGSGAGFPGIPLAIARPDCFVLLMESDGRKATFLREATLDFQNVLVVRARVEHTQHACHWMVSRAVSWADLIPAAEQRAEHLALLVTRETADRIVEDGRLRWRDPIPLPWGKQKVVLIADISELVVSRGT
jgi:16S rRNA (guanine527-N7)-methyltransferase